MFSRLFLVGILMVFVLSGVTACGVKGKLQRPSEIEAPETAGR